MSLRTLLAASALALVALGGCGDEDHHGGDSGHEGHEDGGHEGEGTCPHAGLTAECDAMIDTIGATATGGSATLEVTSATPEDPMAGEAESNMLMVKITDADGNPVTGATLDAVFTEAHGGHASCGTPALTEMDGGMYQVHGLVYPHGGTWHHAFLIDGEEIDLQVCVLNEPNAGG